MKKIKYNKNKFNKKNENHKIVNSTKKNTQDEYFIFSPMNDTSLEKNRMAENNESKNENELKNETPSKNESNVIDKLKKIIDKYFNEDYLIIALIIIILYERINMNKDDATKNDTSDYDLMLIALIYLLI